MIVRASFIPTQNTANTQVPVQKHCRVSKNTQLRVENSPRQFLSRCQNLTRLRPQPRARLFNAVIRRENHSNLGVYSGKLQVPYDAFDAALAIIASWPRCPGGKERMQRLREIVGRDRVDLTPLLTHASLLDEITEGHKTVGERRDGVLR